MRRGVAFALLAGCQAPAREGDCAGDCRIFDVNFVVVTEDYREDGPALDAAMGELVTHLDRRFRDDAGMQIFDWRFKRATSYADVLTAVEDVPACATVLDLGDADHFLENAEISAAIEPCFRDGGAPALFDPAAFNVYIYDGAGEDGDPSDNTSRGGRTGNFGDEEAPALYPRVLIDHARLGLGDNVEAHEFGHTFTLGHLCLVPSQASDRTPAMASGRDWEGCLVDDDGECLRSCSDLGGTGGRRSGGFSEHPTSYDEASGTMIEVPSELATIATVAAETEALLGPLHEGPVRW